MTGALVDLEGLASQIEWTHDRAGRAGRAAQDPDPTKDGLTALRDWLTATSPATHLRRPGPSPAESVGAGSLGPKRAECVVTGPITDRARATAAQLDVRISLLGDDSQPGLELGIATADRLVDEGCDLLVVASGPATPDAALLVGVLLDLEPVEVLPRGAAAVDTRAWIRDAAYLRDRRRDLIGLRHRPEQLLERLDRPSLAAATGMIMRAIARRTPVLLDGADAAAAALLCQDLQSRAAQWWRFADRSPGVVETLVRAELSAEPVLDLGTSTGDGVAALLGVAVLRAAAVSSS